MEPELKVAIIINSDSTSEDLAFNHTAGDLVSILSREGNWGPPAVRLITDDVRQIQRAVCDYTDGPDWQNLVLLVQGTDSTTDDPLPKAVAPLIFRYISGLSKCMMAESSTLASTSFATLPISGVRGKSLILALPGPPRNVTRNLEAVVKLLHACLQTSGARLSSFAEHPRLQPRSNSRHHHNHHHRHGLISTVRPGKDYHTLPHPMLSVQEALRRISEQTCAPVVIKSPITTSIIGSIVAEDVYAAEVVPESRISKFNANANIEVENRALSRHHKDHVEIPVDSEIALRSRIFARGDLISATSGDIGLLAAAGIRRVKVFKKPRVGVLSIGDELMQQSDTCDNVDDRILDSNRLAILSCLKSWDFETVDLGIVRGSGQSLYELFHASSGIDVTVITGSRYEAELDLKLAIERSLGGTVLFDRVSIKPGEQTTFATVSTKTSWGIQEEFTSRLIFSLPGSLDSALVALNIFVLPSLNQLSGACEGYNPLFKMPLMPPRLGLPRVAVVLTHYIPLDHEVTEYHRAVVTGSRSDGRLYATIIGAGRSIGQQCSYPGGTAEANALVVLQPGRGVGIKGEIVEALMMGPISGSDTRIIC
ncbi:hypothetical protein N7532_011346 [Penicillium argentinense]|uniref:MoaB/Mog domain-containing protein n=1 Tax=Penicillium argentinense TaxID=1131581 RepID=A0A9W9JUQ9_9EURO|nr:uncharacterized protein N7532_011346 [Penicillium argentinense]KAJ5082303.1 hypothetical protein N7532_011346 [Penicillium argentinense]